MMRRAMIIVITLVVVGLVATSAALARSGSGSPCIVPNVKGDNLAMARAQLYEDHCGLGRLVTLKQGADLGVIKQIPSAGRQLKRGAKITLEVRPYATRPRAIVLWCSPNPGNSASYATNCSDLVRPSLGNPGDPVRTKPGRQLYFYAYTLGSRQDDVNPSGYLTFKVLWGSSGVSSQPTTAFAMSWFDDSQEQSEPGCARVYSASGEASGLCSITFIQPGTYLLTVGFTDTDRSYPGIRSGPFLTVIVS